MVKVQTKCISSAVSSNRFVLFFLPQTYVP